MRSAALLALSLVLLFAFAACGGEDAGSGTGDVTASSDAAAGTGTDGGTGPGPAGTCSDKCSPTGLKRCQGQGVQTCGDHDGDGCREWGGDEACAEGQTCSNGICSTGCTNECTTVGAVQCAGNAVQRCANHDADICLEWSAPGECPAGQTCSNGQCQAGGCTDECTTVGAKKCDANGVKTCEKPAGETCMKWSASVPCPEGQTCSGGVCQAACTNECTAKGATACEGNGVKTCDDHNNDGCLDWSSVTPCADGETCSGGKCEAGGCTNECTQNGATKCEGNGVTTCGNYDDDTCLEWGSTVPCEEGHTCSGGVCKPPAECDQECTVDGAKACEGDAVKTCGNFDDDTCLEWGTPEACADGQVCSNGQCGPTCLDECPAADATRCDGPGVQICGNYDTDSCLEWGTTVACPEGLTCSAGSCGSPGDCTDECAAESTECDGRISFRTCGEFDGDPCLDWGTSTVCDFGQLCVEGACASTTGDKTCAEIDACAAGCGQDGDCYIDCITTGSADAQKAYENATTCAIAHGCTGAYCLGVACAGEVAACLYETNGAGTCGGIFECLGGCAEGDAACGPACLDAASADAQREYVALTFCVDGVCPPPAATEQCITDAMDPMGDCGPYNLACGAESSGTLDCSGIISCFGDCGVDDAECMNGCFDQGSSTGQTEFLALNQCAAQAECEDGICLSFNCAPFHAECVNEGYGVGDCLSVYDCFATCTEDNAAACLKSCREDGSPLAQAIVSALLLCVNSACPTADPTCIDQAFDETCYDHLEACVQTSDAPPAPPVQ